MQVKRRTQEQRTAATRAALVDAARRLFAQHGYAAVSTPDLAAAAGVTRGALYHHFSDKRGLLMAAVHAIESELTQDIADHVTRVGATDPAAALHAATDAWLDACERLEVRQVLLLDAPVVLGWAAFRQIGLEHGLGLTEALLRAAVDAGQLDPQPLRPLAHVLIGALDEAALYVATHTERAAARLEAAHVLHRLLDGLLAPPRPARAPRRPR